MTPSRMAYVLDVFPKLSETFVATELAELLRRGVEVRILSLHRPQEEIRHRFVAEAGLLDRVAYERSRFPAILREFRPDLLHAHFATGPTAVARGLSADLGVPFTFTAHGYDVYSKPPADFAARAGAAAAVVTVSEANARHITRAFGVPEGRIRVIPCGVDTSRFAPDGARSEPPLAVCVARLVPAKDHGVLLGACAALARRGMDFRCAVVGDGRCRDELEAARERLGLERVVELVGATEQTEVLRWWQRATVAVLSSRREGMPMSLMEAAACGVPAVATAVGGVPEFVEDGVTGLVVPPGNAAALADALERPLRYPRLAAKMGRAARRKVQERFSIQRQVDELLGLWAGLISGGDRP